MAYSPLTGNFPPVMSGPSSLFVSVGEPFSFSVSVDDSNGDAVTVSTNVETSVVTTGLDVTLSTTVTNTTNFKLVVIAKDPAGAATSLTPLVMLCNCYNGGSCTELSEEEQAFHTGSVTSNDR